MSKKEIFTLLSVLLFTMTQNSFAQNDASETSSNQDSLAQIHEGWDRFSISAGGFFSTYNSGISFRSQQLGLGIQIDLEDALGIESTVFALRSTVNYKIGKTKKHTLTVGYFGIRRTARKILEKELELGGIIFPIGTDLSSVFNLSIIRLKYDYAFYQDDRVSIGASFGLFIMPVNLRAQADASEEHITKFVAPLPLLGLRTDFKITKKFYLRQNVEFLYLSFTDFSGGILDLSVFLEHKTFSNVAFGFGINSNRLNISLRNTDSNIEFFGDIRMDYTGLVLYGRYFF